jgi:predicted ferric reductase
MTRLFYATVWILVYLALTFAPLIFMMFSQGREGRGFWREFSVALGFLGLAMIGLQFMLTARFRPLVRPYGIDVVYHFHRQISQVGFFLIIAHVVILIVISPFVQENMLNLSQAPARMQYGVAAVVFLMLVIFLSVRRLGLGLKYESWRLTHSIFATIAVVLAMLHVLGVGYYIDTPAQRGLWITLGAIWIGTLLYIRVVKPLLMLRQPYTIEEVREERGETYTVVFKPEGHKGFQFRPGQFAWLTVWNTPFSVQEHPFSLSSSSMKPGRLEMAIKELGDFTSTVKDLKPGTRAYLDGPYGMFSVDYIQAPGYVFLGGGVGITPIMSNLRTLADRRDQRPLYLFYGNRDLESATFREEIEELQSQLNLKVVYVLEKPHDGWEGETGFITPDLLSRYLPADRMELVYMVCGPVLMLDAVENALDTLGIDPGKVLSENFNLV